MGLAHCCSEDESSGAGFTVKVGRVEEGASCVVTNGHQQRTMNLSHGWLSLPSTVVSQGDACPGEPNSGFLALLVFVSSKLVLGNKMMTVNAVDSSADTTDNGLNGENSKLGLWPAFLTMKRRLSGLEMGCMVNSLIKGEWMVSDQRWMNGRQQATLSYYFCLYFSFILFSFSFKQEIWCAW